MNILVTGGAGYIGSITAHLLKKNGYKVTILDNLIHGDFNRVKDFDFVKGSTYDVDLVKNILVDKKIDAVIHFAAFIEAGESMNNPGKYFYNNYYGSLKLLDALVDADVKKIVFSSTAAVYGIPEMSPITENSKLLPINPYGESKLMVEKTLDWYGKIHGIRSMILRYFNASGAYVDDGFILGEDHHPETHLIPNVIKAAINNSQFNLFGDDYQTPDGTCVRDYIHVYDLAMAHLISLSALNNNHKGGIYNIGTGNGYSNRQVFDMVEQVSKKNINLNIDIRRPGDPDQLIADSSKFQSEFNWKPTQSDLENIIKSAWDWHISL